MRSWTRPASGCGSCRHAQVTPRLTYEPACAASHVFRFGSCKAAQLDAAVDMLEGVLQGDVGGGNRVGGEEALHVVAGLGGAEAAR